MKMNRNVAKGIALCSLLTNIPINSFADDIKTNEDLGKSSQNNMKSSAVDTWLEELEKMNTSRANFKAVVIDHYIYCIGGVDKDGTVLDVVEVYDTNMNTWKTLAPIPTARESFGAEVVGGKIYCIGGSDGQGILDTIEVYDPATNSWRTQKPMYDQKDNIKPKKSFGTVVMDEKIYCIGGNDEGGVSGTVEVFNPKSNTWDKLNTNMPTPRYDFGSVVIDGKIYCIGGNTGTYSNKVEVYDIQANSWDTAKNDIPTARDNFSIIAIDNKIYCVGGRANDSASNKLEVYDTVANSWDESKTGMTTPRISMGGVFVDGKIYTIGGYNGVDFFDKVEVYKAMESTVDNLRAEVLKAQTSKNIHDIENARKLANELEEGLLKKELLEILDNIFPGIVLERKNVTSNVDIYIKSENSLHMALSTNQITFEDYSGLTEIEKDNALTISINSSLPYELNAYMLDEMYNSNKSQKIDMDRLNIRDNLNTIDTEYKEFTAINTKLTLNDSCDAGNGIKHNINLRLNGDEAYPADIYKTVIKFEAQQK